MILLSHNNITNYFQLNFSLIKHSGFTLTEIENMVPWEREVYVTLLKQHIEAEKQAQREQQQRMKSGM